MTNAELAILGLVAECPRHGYEIERVIETRGMRDWTDVGFSSIYYILKKLERDGLIESHFEQAAGRGPSRKVYTLTNRGRELRQIAVSKALSQPEYCYMPIQLGLANLPAVPRAEAVTSLYQYRDQLTQRRDALITRWQAQQPLPYFVDAMFEHSLILIKAELNWTETFIKKLEAEDE
jgi:DNA-binding PadR family transcriptional regulator